jgi:hypothetical protein
MPSHRASISCPIGRAPPAALSTGKSKGKSHAKVQHSPRLRDTMPAQIHNRSERRRQAQLANAGGQLVPDRRASAATRGTRSVGSRPSRGVNAAPWARSFISTSLPLHAQRVQKTAEHPSGLIVAFIRNDVWLPRLFSFERASTWERNYLIRIGATA